MLLLHLRNDLLRHEEGAGDVGIHHQIVVFFSVVCERLRKEDSGIVDQQIDTAEMIEGCFHHLDGGFLIADLSIHKDEIRRRLEVIRPANVREVATTRQPRARRACVTPRPIPLDAPVTMATGCSVVFIECLSVAICSFSAW